MSNQVKKRSEIQNKYKWDLSHIFANDAAWEAAVKEFESNVNEFIRYDGHVRENPRQVIREYFELMKQITPIYEYAFLNKECDNADTNAQSLSDRAMSLYVSAQTRISFVTPELLEMTNEELQELQEDPDMKDYDEFLRNLILQKPHSLSKEQERLMAMMGELEQAPDNIFSMLTNVDMRFPNVHMPDGTEEKLTEGNFGFYRVHDDRSVREESFKNIMNTYGNYGSTIAATYGASVKKDNFIAAARNYSSARAAVMEPLEIPQEVYDNLIHVIHEYIPVLNDYLALRKRVMGVDSLHMWDLYTSIVSDFKMDLPYEKAFNLVLDGLKPMGEDYLDKLREARDNRWIDVYPSEGKSSGAFSAGSCYDTHPYVLLNQNDTLDSAFTIAHELGHTMHSFYSNTSQPFAKADYSLFVAEVASTCNEAVMIRHLLKVFPEKKAQAYLLNHFLEQFRTTCFRQTMFAEFEMIAHNMASEGQSLTKESLSQVYYELNKKYYGGVCEVDAEIANEWMRIPHFYRAFYVYVYATGLCAAVALSDKILLEGESAVKEYRKFLSAGCSVPPIEALKLAGIDMSKPEPIRAAMETFKKTLEQFKEVLQ